MAIFSPGPTVGAISGNVGGTNFANSRNGSIIRQRRAGGQTPQANQLAAQVNLAAQVDRWRELDDLDRQAWIQYARTTPIPNRLGIERYLTGYQTFMHFNLYTEIDVPPAGTLDTTAVNVSFDTLSGFLGITFDGLGSGVDIEGLVYGNRLWRDTPVKFNRDWRKLGSISQTGPTTTASIQTIWNDVFNSLTVGEYIALQFRPTVNDVPVGGWTTQIIQA